MALGTTPQTVTANATYFFRARSAEGCWGAQSANPVTINFPHTLTLISAATTANQMLARNTAITNIVYRRGGSATAVTITWTGTASPSTPPVGITVSLLTDSIVISGTPTELGVYYFTITTVANLCTSVSQSGRITVTLPMRNCNFATPGWGADGLGVISWGTIGNTDIESGTSFVPGTGDRPDQTWSGAVFAEACRNRTTLISGLSSSLNADCRNARTELTGHLFSWCAVMRFADVLCPAPWRVPTANDFRNLHQSFGFPLPSSIGSYVSHNNLGHFMPMDTTGTAWTPLVGGIWGGARFTALTSDLSAAGSRYWSSTETDDGTGARGLALGPYHVWPQFWGGKGLGFALRCVK